MSATQLTPRQRPPHVSVKLRKLRRNCWPLRRHKWREARHWQTGALVEYWCDNCAARRKP